MFIDDLKNQLELEGFRNLTHRLFVNDYVKWEHIGLVKINDEIRRQNDSYMNEINKAWSSWCWTAKAMDLILDKEATESDDVLEAMCLACKRISINR